MIKFFDLGSQRLRISERIDANIARVLEHGQYILGPEVAELEQKLIEYVGVTHCITCANGTDALQIALMALDVGPDDEVITPGFSYIATAEVIRLLGATPIYVDVCNSSYNIDVRGIENKINKNTKAIIPVSLYGNPANFKKINQIAGAYGITVIEDAAQSFGSSYHGKKSCNLSKIACTSFFPTKPLGCYGDGGAIFTGDDDLALKIRQIARHGQAQRYEHVRIGLNSRLDTLQAAVLLAKLEVLDEEIQERSKLSKIYSNLLDGHVQKVPHELAGTQSAWAQYTIQVHNRDEIQRKLKDAGIPTAIHYPKTLPQQKAFYDSSFSLPVSEKLVNSVLSLPMNAYLTKSNVEYIAEKIIR